MAEKDSGFLGGFVVGAMVGGIVGGVIGAALAPRLLRQRPDQRSSRQDSEPEASPTAPPAPNGRRIPVQLQADEAAISQARKTLEDKIAQLNEAIQDTRAQLLVEDPKAR